MMERTIMETILRKKTKAFQSDGNGCEKHTVIYVEPDQEQESQGTQGDQESPAVPPAVPESLEINVLTQDSLV
jgi:hypothetical protein